MRSSRIRLVVTAMSYLIGNVEMQGEPRKVVPLFPEPKVVTQSDDPDFPGITMIAPYKSRFRRRREAMGLATAPHEGVCDLSMRRADVVDTAPCDLDPCAGYVAPAWDPA